MKKMQVVKWQVKSANGENVGREESIVDVNTNVLSRASNSMGSGIDQFRFIHRVSEGFDKAEKTGMLEIEDTDYAKITDLMKNNMPAGFGFSKDIYSSVENFLKL